MSIAASLAATTGDEFVDLSVPWWAWLALVGVIAALLIVDLLRHRDDHEPTWRETLAESSCWVAIGLGFAGVVALAFGGGAFGEYVSGYLIEKSLSVDNVFVWAILFSALAVPLKYQHRVLFWGVFGALVFRAAFIAVGSVLLGRFWWLLPIFGGFLVYTGIKVYRHRNDDDTDRATRGLGLLRRVVPVTNRYDGHRFFTSVNGRRTATPLLAALVVIEITDLVFALDSVPAILAVSNEPFLVFSSNAFAILGMRALYFLLAGARQRFTYLSHALGAILVLVGLKMAVSHWFHVDTFLSLGVIVAVLASAVGAGALTRERHVNSVPATLSELAGRD